MKFRNLVVVGGVLFLTFKAGELMGNISCKRELAKQKNSDICDEPRLVEIAGKRFKLTIFESAGRSKKAEGEAQ